MIGVVTIVVAGGGVVWCGGVYSLHLASDWGVTGGTGSGINLLGPSDWVSLWLSAFGEGYVWKECEAKRVFPGKRGLTAYVTATSLFLASWIPHAQEHNLPPNGMKNVIIFCSQYDASLHLFTAVCFPDWFFHIFIDFRELFAISASQMQFAFPFMDQLLNRLIGAELKFLVLQEMGLLFSVCLCYLCTSRLVIRWPEHTWYFDATYSSRSTG